MKTPNEIAALFGVTPAQIRRLCKRGKIPAYRVGSVWRMEEEEVRAILANKTQAAFNKPKI